MDSTNFDTLCVHFHPLQDTFKLLIYFWLMGCSKVCHLVSKYLVIIQRPLWFWHLIFNFYQRTYFLLLELFVNLWILALRSRKFGPFWQNFQVYLKRNAYLARYWVECSISVNWIKCIDNVPPFSTSFLNFAYFYHLLSEC